MNTRIEAHVLTELDRHGPTQIATLHGEFSHMRSTLTNILEPAFRKERRSLPHSRSRGATSRQKKTIVLLADTGGRYLVRAIQVDPVRARRGGGDDEELERFARVVAKLMRLPERDVDSITGRHELFSTVEAHDPRTR